MLDTETQQVIDPLDGVVSARWTGSTDRLGIGLDDGTVGVYDLSTHSLVEGVNYALLDSRVTIAQSSADGTRFYLGYFDGRIQTLDSATGEEIAPVIQAPGIVGSISATTGGSRVLVASFRDQEWAMTIHDATTGQQLAELPDVNAVRVASDGTLVIGNLVGEITEYDLETLQPLGSFPGLRAVVNLNGLRFSNDGNILIASSLDRTFSIYDVATRTRLSDPIPFEFTTGALGIPLLRPDGMAVAVGSSDGIIIWDLDPEHLATAACRFAGRNLTRTEWDTHLTALGDYRPTCPERS